jgi:hypothetical protein
MPAAEALIDSNVLLYALSDAPGERPKRTRAQHLLATEDFGTSYQVIMETWVVATRKMAKPVPPEKVAAFLERILEFPCVPGTPGLYRQSLRLVHGMGFTRMTRPFSARPRNWVRAGFIPRTSATGKPTTAWKW